MFDQYTFKTHMFECSHYQFLECVMNGFIKGWSYMFKSPLGVKELTLINSKDLIGNSPYCLPYSSCDVSLENLVLDQLLIPWLIFFFILITCLLDIVLML